MDVPSTNHLPPELLVEITTFIPDQSTIFRLATVCRHWHDALTEAAILWISVDCRSESRTSILLQRSKSVPIDVTVDCFRYAPGAISLVANHIHRMRSIDVTLCSRTPANSYPPYSRAPADVYYLLNGSAPILKAVRMQGGDYPGPIQPLPLHSSSFRGQFPALRTLWLEGYPFDLAQSVPTMTSGLTTLVLDNQRLHDLRDLLDYLEHCENLEHLKINLPNLEGTVLAPRIVSLPKLRELQLVSLPLTTLHHLSFPPSSDLTVQPHAMGSARGYLVVDVWTEDGLLHIFESRTIKGIKITFTGHKCVVGLSGSHLALTVKTFTDLSRPSSFYSDYLDSFQSLPIKTTESFVFARLPPYPFAKTLRLQSCTRLLTQMPALEQITLDISIAPSFIRALELVDGDLLCHKLRELIIVRRAHDKVNLWNRLLALSSLRKDHGCPLMYRVGLYTSSDWENLIPRKGWSNFCSL